MRLAILSDSHGQRKAVQTALALCAEQQVDLLLHCGDIDNTDTIWEFSANTHFVFGNCDQDRLAMGRAIAEVGATLHTPFGRLEVAGQRLAFLHGDDEHLLQELATGGQYDYVFHGHTHQAAEHHYGATRIINPGALYRAQQKSFVILDLPQGEAVSALL